MGIRLLANMNLSLDSNCQIEIKFCPGKMRKFFRDKIWESHVIGGSPMILGSASPKPEVLGNLRYDLVSRTVTYSA